jgi:hypothetical protein
VYLGGPRTAPPDRAPSGGQRRAGAVIDPGTIRVRAVRCAATGRRPEAPRGDGTAAEAPRAARVRNRRSRGAQGIESA